MRKITFGVVALGVSVIASSCAYAQSGWGYLGGHNEEGVLKSLAPVLASAGKVARIYYLGVCPTEDGTVKSLSFPKVEISTPSKGSTGLTAVREMFKTDKQVAVKEGESGIIRITVGRVPLAILQTKIPLLRFERFGGLGEYNPSQAILEIEQTTAMKRAMRRLNVHLIPMVIEITLMPPAKGFPHLPPLVTNVTADEALDLIAKTFKLGVKLISGVWGGLRKAASPAEIETV